MSCPFKPGDRIELMRYPVEKPDCTVPLGHLATVVDGAPAPFERDFFNSDFLLIPDGLTDVYASWSYCWRRIDGPSGESAESFLQSLSKPKVEA